MPTFVLTFFSYFSIFWHRLNEPSKYSLNVNKKKFFYSACIIKEHIIIIKLIGKLFNITTCSPELYAFAVLLSIVVSIPGAIVVVAIGTCVVVVVGTCVVVVVSAIVVVVIGTCVVVAVGTCVVVVVGTCVVVVVSATVVVVVGSSVVVVEAEDILNLN